MKVFSKLWAVILSVVMCLAVFGGCGGGGRREIPGWDDSKQNVVFYTWGNAEENAILQDIMDDFMAENEEINLIIQKAGNDYYGDLALKLANPNLSPDIVLMKPGYIQSFLESGAIISLQDYIDKSSVIEKDTMLWDVNDGYRYNKDTKVTGNSADPVYSLVKDFSPDFVLNYNKKKVTEGAVSGLDYPKDGSTFYPSKTQPMTWDQFIQFGKAIQTSAMTGTTLDNEPYQQLLEWIQMGGGSLYSQDEKKVADIKGDAAVRQAFDYYRMMRDEATDNTAITKNSSVQVGPGQLKEGQTASMFYGRWAYSTYGLGNAASVDCAFAPPAVPKGFVMSDDAKFAGITAMVGMSISATSKQKDAAFKFMEYYFTAGQEKLATLGYNVPGNKLVAETTFVGEGVPAKEREINQFFLDLAKNHSFVIKFNKYINQKAVETVLSKHLTQYFADSKNKPFSNAKWESALDGIKSDLQVALDRAIAMGK